MRLKKRSRGAGYKIWINSLNCRFMANAQSEDSLMLQKQEKLPEKRLLCFMDKVNPPTAPQILCAGFSCAPQLLHFLQRADLSQSLLRSGALQESLSKLNNSSQQQRARG